MLLLPEEPMERRRPDARIGYFTANQVDFGTQEHRAKPVPAMLPAGSWFPKTKKPTCAVNLLSRKNRLFSISILQLPKSGESGSLRV
jgi:hypothetical protein